MGRCYNPVFRRYGNNQEALYVASAQPFVYNGQDASYLQQWLNGANQDYPYIYLQDGENLWNAVAYEDDRARSVLVKPDGTTYLFDSGDDAKDSTHFYAILEQQGVPLTNGESITVADESEPIITKIINEKVSFSASLEDFQISVNSLNGRKLYAVRVSESVTSVSIPKLPAGLYVLSLEYENKSEVRTVIAQ